MMRCDSCGKEWDPMVEGGTGRCPACGQAVLRGISQEVKELPEETMKYIVERFGVETLQNGKRVAGLLSDILQNDRKRMMSNILQDGLSRKIFELISLEELEREIRLRSLMDSFTGQYGYGKEHVSYVIDCLKYALGWIERVNDGTDRVRLREKQKVRVAFLEVKKKGFFSSDKFEVTVEASGVPICDMHLVISENTPPIRPECFIPVIIFSRNEFMENQKITKIFQYQRGVKNSKLFFRIVPALSWAAEQIIMVNEMRKI